MQYAPNAYKPGAYNVYNGRPTYAKDALDVDRYSTWLAASRKYLSPVLLGSPFDATNTATAASFDLLIPAYTQYTAWSFLCTGNGSITLTLTDDPWNVVVPVLAYEDGDHVFAQASAIHSGPPKAGVVANGVNRALATTFQSSWHRAATTIAVTDEGGGVTLRVWMVRPIFLPPMETAVLPA